MSNAVVAVNKQELRRFGLTTGAIVIALFGLLLPWLLARPFPVWPWAVAGILWPWALLLPATLGPLYRVWMALGHVLGWINTRIILSVLFYGLLLPTGIILRLLGKDAMKRTFDKQVSTYRVQSTVRSRKHMEKPF